MAFSVGVAVVLDAVAVVVVPIVLVYDDDEVGVPCVVVPMALDDDDDVGTLLVVPVVVAVVVVVLQRFGQTLLTLVRGADRQAEQGLHTSVSCPNELALLQY